MNARTTHPSPRASLVARSRASILALGQLLLVAACTFAGCRAPDSGRTATERRFDEIVRSSHQHDHLVLAMFVSNACVPCRRLEDETFHDPRVVRRVEELGVESHRFAVEELPVVERELDVVAVPQVIAWRHGVEIDRLRGYVDPAAFLAWLDALERGGTRLGVLRERARARPDDGATVHAFAAEALRRDALDEAAEAYERLWSMPASARGELGVRVPDETAELVRRSPAARERLARRWTSLEAEASHAGESASASANGVVATTNDAVPATTDDGPRGDWIDLGHALGEDARVAAWFATLAPDDVRAELVQARRESVWRALRAAGRFDEIVRFVEVSVPVTSFARARAVETSFEREMLDAASLAAMRVERARDLDDLRKGCSATGRAADAAEIERLARENGLK